MKFPPLPDSKYSIIYTDPPWKYKGVQHAGPGKANTGGAKSHYPTVDVEVLKELDVMRIADDDCLLFMWTTGPKLDLGVDLGKAWGFTYITIAFVWDKCRPNPGYYTMSECEICLLFKKGRIPLPRGARNIRQLIRAKRGEHSQKPDEARYRIECMFPEQSKIEMFARNKFIGWDVWGFETDKRLSEIERKNILFELER